MASVIRLQNVVKRFGNQTALDDVSFEVPEGVVFALLGENGAGKSTTIRILLGQVEPDAGTSAVLGLDSQRNSLDIRRRVGIVSERPALYEWMTVEQTGWFAAGFHGPEFFNSFQRAVGHFALPSGKKIKQLSKGMRAKVALALALANDPELLILDEPTSGLDTLVRREFLESMVDRAAQGKTVFLSSHQIQEVERVADYVAILCHGKLIAVERLEKLKAETHELTVTLSDPAAHPVVLDGELLRQRRRARQWQILVRGDEQTMAGQLRNSSGVDSVESRTPSLEEIFVAYMSRGSRGETANVEPSPTAIHEND